MDITSLKQVYQDCFVVVQASKNHIAGTVMVFVVGVLIGACFPDTFAETLMPILKDLVQQTQGLSWGALTVFIFHNNFTAAVIGMLSGLLLFLIPYLHANANGIVLGFVLQRAGELTGSTQWWKLIPHGIFELPAVFIALGLGVYLGLFWQEEDKLAAAKQRLLVCLKTCALVVAPLLVIAAIIEASMA